MYLSQSEEKKGITFYSLIEKRIITLDGWERFNVSHFNSIILLTLSLAGKDIIHHKGNISFHIEIFNYLRLKSMEMTCFPEGGE